MNGYVSNALVSMYILIKHEETMELYSILTSPQ